VSDLAIRPEIAADRARVERIHALAFGRPDEAGLVRALRSAAQPVVSLVAERRGGLVRHVMVSPVSVEGSSLAAGGLAPLAVDPDAQRRGAGAALVRAALPACAALGWRAVFLLGDPAYYARFGFAMAAPRGLHYESEAFDTGFQVLELAPGSLAGHTCWVRYHPAFARLP
jgi:putative acetyltransferase